MLIWMLVSFAFEAVNGSIFHSRFYIYHFLCFGVIKLCFTVWHDEVSPEAQLLLTPIKKLFKCAGASNAEVFNMGVCSFCYCILVNVCCNLLNHFDLFSSSIQRNCKRIGRSEELLKDFNRISTEVVSLDAICTRVAILERGLPIPVIDFTQLLYKTLENVLKTYVLKGLQRLHISMKT